MVSKAEKMYGNSPHLERDEESGKMGIKKSATKASEEHGTEGMHAHERHEHERRVMHHRHLKEHMDLHHKHEMEHSMHEAMKHGHKGALHERHEREYKEMHARHHSEMKDMHDRHEKEADGKTGESKIEKIEKDAKE